MERKGIFIKVFSYTIIALLLLVGVTAICVLFQSDGITANSKILSAIGGTDSE